MSASMNRYRIKFFRDQKLIRQTALRFPNWERAHWYLTRILRFEWKNNQVGWEKEWEKEKVTAEIVCKNGIPF